MNLAFDLGRERESRGRIFGEVLETARPTPWVKTSLIYEWAGLLFDIENKLMLKAIHPDLLTGVPAEDREEGQV